MKTSSSEQKKFMQLALKLAKKGKGQTSPNPMVGAVVVKNGQVIGQGYHRKAGRAHAEVVALEQAGTAARGGSLYVTLEPCCHWGRTGPCVQKIVACGIKEVVLAMLDPNPLNNGRGAQFLRRHGIRVLSGVLEQEAGRLNVVFIKYITRRLPFVTVKVAQSLDGKIATKTGDSRWISSIPTRNFAHRLRNQVDAILVGVNTIIKDDPLLSTRLNGCLHPHHPQKIIVDTRLRLPLEARIFSTRSPAQVIIATTRFAPAKKVAYFQKKGVQVIIAKEKGRRVDLVDLFKKLTQQEISHILVEGGGEIIASALENRLVDRMIVVISSQIIGGRGAPTAVEGAGISRIKQALRLKELKLHRLGPDLMLEGRPS
ncbi:MAG: bifunctional diaminohydroxyphosphoribosylaminopyrimidine deaminase/5-amino-6-(5-phosphoribosylamino)uracil reductase RibD [Candidatus Omnitrophica bacterium]|nr:bifunctional diaminohydroxyphosphoribosylaminopyrimidine deaminase/5-amino-6-(5-phosphoribosylamino)uracil reductase RibD [Candidatus Omnitrophota bacterium]